MPRMIFRVTRQLLEDLFKQLEHVPEDLEVLSVRQSEGAWRTEEFEFYTQSGEYAGAEEGYPYLTMRFDSSSDRRK